MLSQSAMSDSVTPWTVAHQAPLSMGFSRQEYWSGCSSLLHGIFPTQGSNPRLLCCRQILRHLSHQGSPIGSALQNGTTTLEDSLAVSYKAKHAFCTCMSAQLCPTLCGPKYNSLPGFSVHGISQARILDWVTICFSRESS